MRENASPHSRTDNNKIKPIQNRFKCITLRYFRCMCLSPRRSCLHSIFGGRAGGRGGGPSGDKSEVIELRLQITDGFSSQAAVLKSPSNSLGAAMTNAPRTGASTMENLLGERKVFSSSHLASDWGLFIFLLRIFPYQKVLSYLSLPNNMYVPAICNEFFPSSTLHTRRRSLEWDENDFLVSFPSPLSFSAVFVVVVVVKSETSRGVGSIKSKII